MGEPTTLAGNEPSDLARLRARLAQRGLDVADLGPLPPDQPRPEDPGHPEYHRQRRAEAALARWQAATPRRYRDATASEPRVLAWADRVAADLNTAGNLLLTGPIGPGKTHQAYGALRRVAEAGPMRFEMLAFTAPDMYGLMRRDGSHRAPEEELRRLCRIPLLFVDDFGVEKPSEWVDEVTYRIINDRYVHCRPTLFTSNLPVRSDHGESLASKLGERIISRLAENTTAVAIVGPDRRFQRGAIA